ncbi:MAG: Na/Pi cotransporter family protein [Prevotella sp.]|nr:Na/Pi cotransporter family protein [Prevotella sp.]
MVSMKILGALGLLIFGMKLMSESLQKMAGPQLRHILASMTTNRWTGMLTGVLVTCAVQSSSATTVMTVSFVNAGLLTLAQAISIIMGANIGTTLTAWIISLGYNLDLTAVVFPAFLIGMILIYRHKHRFVGEFLFGVAFMFYSLVMLSQSGKSLDLANNEAVVNFFASFDTSSHLTIIAFLLIGTIITCIVQSSAAVMAITIMLCSTGVLPIYMGIALVMGENIGTTATANLAALGANRQARRAALAHLIFNVIGVTWVLLVFYPFVEGVCYLSGYDVTAGGQAEKLPIVLAMFHTCFNITNTLLLIGFIPQIEKVCNRIIQNQKETDDNILQLKYIHSNLIQTPEIAVLQAQKEIVNYAANIQKMFGIVETLLNERDNDKQTTIFKQVEQLEGESDKVELDIADFLQQVSESTLSDETTTKINLMLRTIGELESIADSSYNLARILNRRTETDKDFTADQYIQLNMMTRLTNDALTQMNLVMNGFRENHTIEETYRIENDINTMRNRVKAENINKLEEHQYKYAVGVMYIDFINECEKLGDYVVNVVQARLR